MNDYKRTLKTCTDLELEAALNDLENKIADENPFNQTTLHRLRYNRKAVFAEMCRRVKSDLLGKQPAPEAAS